MFKINDKETGQASRLLLVLAIIILVAIVITYLVMRAAEKPPKPVTNEPTVSQPAYEQSLGDIKFIFMQARDMGNVLKGTESRNSSWQKDLTTTEKFIKVTIGAQNKGLVNIKEQVWNVGDIVDSDGRNFVPLQYNIDSWLPDPNLCGALLKPEFEPAPCVKIYEVSRISKGLKIQVISLKKVGNEYPSDKKDTALIDLIVTQ
ncbi:MAG: hypothetical protein A3G45_01590 [Candidatus Staskawiczbacteria bacterium RIFCSPLOWO2_12_FULL_37_15]|uniref:DUF4352 domain-containing protein n=1 Tax=Candidatus Staskawiczbacteria bacterium RIFCSPLOWO2_12_FULL_37_15 TaxID=1802218 RepID=A0A1G2ILX0_9BACT|nr:MAG: hypothetical protein A3G45_01590 [Candidatus Staskawiczbacteria bacterium RIFCSPLOWO2_12_FULL_37_15]